ncbi:glycosyltransferase [Fusobacterium necrogenes]|uniref:glycosyltransferase n=1 Tax=Fusobacterium necrogenes TaxID=858 RepID=UPI00255CA63A|nr:glycosyltransferase [Fusobacterium necrogenes]
MKTIVVNNPAAKEGGALTILKNFLETIYNSKCNNKFYIFVSLEKLKKFEKENIKIIVIGKQNFEQRVIWDNYGLKKYLKVNNIEPDLFLSIQNTGVNLPKNILQLLYYHQPLPISEKKWNFFKREERKYWFYKNIYPFFIKQYLNRVDKVIVQTEWIKEGFSKKFNYKIDNIVLDKPIIKIPDIDKIEIIPKNKFRIFYPAAPLIYKNHKVIIESLGELKKEVPNLNEKLECIFTFSSGENLKLDKLIKKYQLENIVKLIGKIPYEKVLCYYKSSDLMIFPSYIETLGLPLIEAQYFNLVILVLDLPYTRELLERYNNFSIFDRDLKLKIFSLLKNKKIK